MDFSFEIDIVGQSTKKHYKGSFTYSRPNILTNYKISKTFKDLLGSEGFKDVTDEEAVYPMMLSMIRHSFIQFPDWWKESNYGFELRDQNVIDFISNKILEFETEWQNNIPKPIE